MGPGSLAAPAQLQGQVLSQTFTAEPPNCGTSSPTTASPPPRPAHLNLCVLFLCWAGSVLAAEAKPPAWQLLTKSCPSTLLSVRKGQEMPLVGLRETGNFTLQLNGDKEPHTPPTKSPFVSCPRSHETEWLHYDCCRLLNLVWYFETAPNEFSLRRTLPQIVPVLCSGGALSGGVETARHSAVEISQLSCFISLCCLCREDYLDKENPRFL